MVFISFVEVRGGQTKAYSISELKFVGLKVRCRTYPDKGLTKAHKAKIQSQQQQATQNEDALTLSIATLDIIPPYSSTLGKNVSKR